MRTALLEASPESGSFILFSRRRRKKPQADMEQQVEDSNEK